MNARDQDENSAVTIAPSGERDERGSTPEQDPAGRGGSGMTSPISEYPRKCLGKVAEVNGMTADGPWIAVRDAFGVTGVGSGVLARWEEAGVISVLQNREGSPRLYLKPELEEVAKLGKGAPPTLRAVRRYVASRVGGGGRVERAAGAGARPGGVPGPETSGGAAFVNTLANLLRGQRFTTEIIGAERVRVTKGADSRGVEIECRRRASDGDRWWFSWGGGVWMCEAENLADAVVQVKSALRTVRSAR